MTVEVAMIDLRPLIGVAIITIGLALRLNTLLVVLCAGIVRGLCLAAQAIAANDVEIAEWP